MTKSGSGSEHSATAGDFVEAQPELLSSKYQRKTKLLKSIAKVSPSIDREPGGSTVLTDERYPITSKGGSNLTKEDNCTTSQSHATVAVSEGSLEDTKTPVQVSGPNYMRDESSPAGCNGASDAQSSDPQPPPISPETDLTMTSTTPRQVSPDPQFTPQLQSPIEATNEDVDISDLPHLSAADLDRAKNLVLDLLGWGVQPEYLLSAGLSHELAFRVFADLNLRMPTNLKITDTLMDVAYSLGRDVVAPSQPP